MPSQESVTAPDRTCLIGRALSPVRYTIREDDIQDYLPVAGEEQAVFLSDEAALTAGYERRIIPPSFAPFCCGAGTTPGFRLGAGFFV